MLNTYKSNNDASEQCVHIIENNNGEMKLTDPLYM